LSLNSTNLDGDITGSLVEAQRGVIDNLSGSQLSLSGNLIVDGDISGSMATDNITASTITGSSIISGSNVYGAYSKFTNTIVTNLTGSSIVGTSLVSGSSIQGQTGTLDTINSVTINNSGTISGSTIQGQNATLDAVSSKTVIGATSVSGSTLQSQTSTIDAVSGTTVIGSSSVSGSAIQGQTGTIDTVNAIDVSGSSIVMQSSGLHKTASYIVYSGSSLGGPYFAESGNNGLVEYSGSVGHTLFNSVVTDLSGSGGGSIFIKAGMYSVTGSINLSDSINVYGEGENTKITLVSGSNSPIFNFNGVDNCTISNMALDGNKSNQNSECHVIDVTGTTYLTIDNIHISDGYTTGIRIGGSNNSSHINVYDCWFESCGNTDSAGYYAFWATDVSGAVITNIVVKNCKITDPLRVGIAIHGVSGSVIDSNYCYNASTIGIAVGEGSIDTTISKNTIDTTGDNGIDINTGGGYRALVIGNHISNAGNGGIVADASHDSIVSNNEILSPTNDGIYIYASNNVIVSNNKIITPSRYGIQFGDDSSPSDNCSCTGNYIYQAGDHALRLYYADKTLVSGNHIENMIASGKYSVRIYASTDCQITGNILNTCASALAIMSGGSDRGVFTGNYCKDGVNGIYCVETGWVFSGNMFYSNTIGVEFPSGGSYNLVEGNYFLGNPTAVKFSSGGNSNRVTGNYFSGSTTNINNAGTGNIVKYNSGYVTENDGYASGSTGMQVAHGLSTVPTKITITASGSNPNLFATALSGSSHFYVYHSGSATQGLYWDVTA